jgi:hypothetical protein
MDRKVWNKRINDADSNDVIGALNFDASNPQHHHHPSKEG